MSQPETLREEFHVEVCNALREKIREADLVCPPRDVRYDEGHVFDLEIRGVLPDTPGRAVLRVERFVGGGFAGQVYRCVLESLELKGPSIPGLEPGRTYAVKILIPPSAFSRKFRDTLYEVAYQGPFSMQVNAAAARCGLLWQKLIRGGAKVRLGRDDAVADTYAGFWLPEMNSFGEINEWVNGRVWRLETDEKLFERGKLRKKWLKGEPVNLESPEYEAKKRFLGNIVRLLHDMGAPELARQYEWWTLKSQPNVLKRTATDPDPMAGLTAIDFRAGLALLPFLPMSPKDVSLILKGLFRGKLVQFDRANYRKLDDFVQANREEFRELLPAVEELKRLDPVYRDSLPDVTHHGLRLLMDGNLRRSAKAGIIEGWRAREYVDEEYAEKQRKSGGRFWEFWFMGLLPILGVLLFFSITSVGLHWVSRTVPEVGSLYHGGYRGDFIAWQAGISLLLFFALLVLRGPLLKLRGSADYRKHVRSLFRLDYLRRELRAKQAFMLIQWYRTGRACEKRVWGLWRHPVAFWIQVPLAWLPPAWHRFFVEPRYLWRVTILTVGFPIRLYCNGEFRVKWFSDQVKEGYREGMLTEAERDHILSRVGDPFIQKYLKCLAVHICTIPATQIVSLAVAWIYMATTKDTGAEMLGKAAGILILFQVMPISPGSLLRGLYVDYLMIKERNWRQYYVAAILSHWKYIGYLGFPIQMVKEFPDLSLFMAARYATHFASVIPVFGERGALLQHAVFDVFFNLPISIRRAFRKREPEAEGPIATNE